MKKCHLMGLGLALASVLAAAPAAAQTTWNFGDGGNCDINGSTATHECRTGTNSTLRAEGYAAAAGGQYVRGTLTAQGGSGMGFTAPGETSAAPEHAFDNNGSHELLLLDFGLNRVVLTGVTLGWGRSDTDLSLLRWAGTGNPASRPSTNVTTASLLSSGWVLVGAADLDGTSNTSGSFGRTSVSTGVPVTEANSSSWWIISSYFGATTGNLDAGNDYFKLLSIQTNCVANGTGGGCATTPPTGVPEPGSLALAGLALAGLALVRRRRRAA